VLYSKSRKEIRPLYGRFLVVEFYSVICLFQVWTALLFVAV